MASLERRSRGSTTGNNAYLSMGGSGSTASNFISNNLHLLRTVEIFWFITSTTVQWRYIYSIRNTSSGSYNATGQNGYYQRLFFTTATTLTWGFRDNGNSYAEITVPNFPVSTGLNTWWHSVLYKNGTVIGDPWYCFHGRTGQNIDGSTRTPDTWPYPYSGQSTLPTAGTSIYAVRPTQTDVTRVVLAGSFTDGTGTATTSNSRLPGGVAEFRLWSDNRGLIFPYGVDGFIDLRDQFIDGVSHPTLSHCFRLNEPVGAAAADYDDVGSQNGAFVGSLTLGSGAGFSSHPFPAGSSGIADFTAIDTTPASVDIQANIFARRRYQANDTTATAESTLPGLRVIRRFATPADSTATVEPTPGIAVRRRFTATDETKTPDSATFKVNPGFSATDTTSTYESITLFVRRRFAVTDETKTVDNTPELIVNGGAGGNTHQFTVSDITATNEAPLGLTVRRVFTASDTTTSMEATVTPVFRRRFTIDDSTGTEDPPPPPKIIRRFSVVDETKTIDTITLAGGSLAVVIPNTVTFSAPLLTLEEYMSVLDIWNTALVKLGVEGVTSAPTSDGSPQGEKLASAWPLFKGKFLRSDDWDGGKTTALLSLFYHGDGTTMVTPNVRWTYAYVLPSDHVRSLRMNGRLNYPGQKDISGLGLWEEETVTNDAGTKKRCLLTNDAPASLEYIFRVGDADILLLPDDMRWAMALSLAAHVATGFGKTTTEIEALKADAEEATRAAVRSDNQTGARITVRDSTIADAFY